MTPTEFQSFARTLHVNGSEWASGWVANGSIYQVDIPVPTGAWYLSFINPNSYIPTGVGIYSDITLRPA